MRFRWVVAGTLGMLLPLGAMAGSITTQQRAVPYTAVVTVDQTATEIVIDFNGDALPDPAGILTLFNKTGDGIYCVDRGTATVLGAPLEVGQTFTFNRRGSTGRITRLSCVAATSESATLYIWADP